MRLYDYLLPLVVRELSQLVTKIHLSFNGWTVMGCARDCTRFRNNLGPQGLADSAPHQKRGNKDVPRTLKNNLRK
jgi:hypothetical protein